MKKPLFITAITILLFSFTSKHPYGHFFDIKKLEKSMMLIPGGSYNAGASDKDSYHDTNRAPNQVIKVDSFYMCTHEVSNGEYLYFINELKRTDTLLYKKMLPDTQVWRSAMTFNEPFTIYYFRHPAYSYYPLVGITYEQAAYYCQWLTEKYMSDAKRKYKKVRFRLPSLKQWTYAAMGGRANAYFPWAGNYMTDEKGRAMANFNMVPQQYIYRADVVLANDKGEVEQKKILAAPISHGVDYPDGHFSGDITTTIQSYWPNNYDLYNMAGNVEEYVLEKGIAKGGSWKDPGYYLQNYVQEKYDASNYTSAERGFRFMMEVVK